MKPIPIRHINKAQKEPIISESFGIRDIKKMLGGHDMEQELHRHDFYLLLVLNKGTGHHEIDFVSYPIGDRTVFLMSPGQVHKLTLKANSTGYLIQFKPDFYHSREKSWQQLLRQTTVRNHYQPGVGTFKKILASLDAVYEEYTGQKEKYHEAILANLAVLLIELLRQTRQNSASGTLPYTQERMEEFSALLDKHLAEQKPVSEYAGLMNLTSYQLNAITKASFGKTCLELINERMVLEAKRYLLATSNQVSQIALLLGYEDVSYFIRFFKKHTGYSPESFRHNFK